MRAIKWLITLPFRIVWKLRKVIVIGLGAFAAYVGWQKRNEASQDDAGETSPTE